MLNILLLLHLLGVIVWVGGMFFAHMVLRPAAAELLQPPQRLPLLNGVFRRFFPWVWLSVTLIATSGGLLMALLGGFKAAWYIHAMLAIGVMMMAIFTYVFFVPFAKLKQGVASQDWPAAGLSLASIRKLVGVNLTLGLLTTCVALGGRLFSGS